MAPTCGLLSAQFGHRIIKEPELDLKDLAAAVPRPGRTQTCAFGKVRNYGDFGVPGVLEGTLEFAFDSSTRPFRSEDSPKQPSHGWKTAM